jgi:hypothetical protein
LFVITERRTMTGALSSEGTSAAPKPSVWMEKRGARAPQPFTFHRYSMPIGPAESPSRRPFEDGSDAPSFAIKTILKALIIVKNYHWQLQ